MSREQWYRYAVYIAGLALLFAMDRPPVFAFLLANTTEQTRLARSAADFTLIALGAVLYVASYRFPSLLKAKRPLALVGGLLTAAASLAIALNTHAGVLPASTLTAASIAFSAGHLLLVASWFIASRALPSARLMPAVLLAFALSMGLVAVDFLPAAGHLATVVILPLVCATLAALTGDDDLSLGLLEPYERPPFKRVALIDALAVGLLFAEMLSATLIRSLWAHQGIGYTASQTAMATYLLSLCLALLCAAACAKSGFAEKGAFAVGVITLPVLVAAASAFLFLDGNSLAVSIVTSVSSVAAASLMAMISIAFRGERLSYLAGAGAYAAALGIANWLSYSVLPYLLHFTGSAPSQLTAPIVFMAISAIMVVLACAFGAMLLESARSFEEWQRQTTAATIVIKANRKRDGECAGELDDPCARGDDYSAGPHSQSNPSTALSPSPHELLRERFSLTEREADIAELLARGYTAKRVAEDLTLSVSTVQSYTKTIYRKMDVHKKDELIEKIGVLQ